MKALEANIHDVTFIQLTTTVVALVSLLFQIPTSTDLLLIFIGYFLYSCIGVVIFYHRYWSHKSFKTWQVIETVGTVLGAFAGRGSALSWATVHRLHHKHTDSDLDPHWSDRDGWKIFFPFMLKYNAQKLNPFMIKDILTSKLNMFIHENYRLIILIYISVLAFFGLDILLYFWVFPIALTAWALNAFVYLSHKNNVPVDSWFVSLILWGEGWHVLHHDKPGGYILQNKSHKIDPAGYIIKLIRKNNV